MTMNARRVEFDVGMKSDLNPSRFPRTVIRASAGTGKTFQLSNRYLALLNAGAAPDQILATTFTRKAAAEILDRIVVRLAEAAENQQACDALAPLLNDPTLTRERCRTLLKKLLSQLHRLQICTLDSFFSKLARGLSLEVGLPVAWRIVDEMRDSMLRDEAIEAVIHNHETQELLTLTHLLTKGEASRSVGELIRRTVNELESLFQDTTREAWHQLPRYAGLSSEELQVRLDGLRELTFADKRFEKSRLDSYDKAVAGDWEDFISSGLPARVMANETTFYNKPIPPEATAIYERLLDQARAILVGRIALQTEGSHELLAKFAAIYDQLKRDRRAIRFADIARRLAMPLRASLNSSNQVAEELPFPQMSFRLDSHIQHLLLDEFQDTAPVQWEVLRPFAQRATRDGEANSFFCVGDTKQAIYGWRGGVAEIFDAITRELPNLEQRGLNESFRSSEAVIDTVNQIFSGLPRHTNLDRAEAAVRAWSQRFEPHSTRRIDLPGYVSLATATDAEKLLEETASHVAVTASRVPDRSIGVLVRRNETVGRLIGLLRERGVLASEEGGNPLTESAAVLLVMSLLKLADHPSDTVARFHVATSPLGEAVGLTNFRDHLAAAKLSYTLRRTISEQGYGYAVAGWCKLLQAHCHGRELSRLGQLVELAFTYQTQATSRVDHFLDYVAQQRVADPAAAQVRVMTVHQAKGLEFDIVVLPELDVRLIGQPDNFVIHRKDPISPIDRICRYVNADLQKLLPSQFQRMFEDATERNVTESLCVFYVALTRAAHALHMIIAPSKASERSLPLTYAGLLRAALGRTDPAPPESVLFEYGNRDWYLAARREPAAPTPVSAALPERVLLAKSSRHRRRGLDRQSPSGMKGGARVRVAELFAARPTLAMLRGTIVHAWFERIEWLDQGQPDLSELARVARDLQRQEADTVDVDELLSVFREMVIQPKLAECLSRTAYAAGGPTRRELLGLAGESLGELTLRVENERAFAIRVDSQLISGSIDRLVWVYSGTKLVAAEIIDFKTDAAESDEAVAAKVETYREQLLAYREAICQMSVLEPNQVIAKLLFVGSGRVARVV